MTDKIAEGTSDSFVPCADGADPRSDNKPIVEDEEAKCISEVTFGIQVETISSLESYDDLNYRIITTDKKEYVLKISNAIETKTNLDLQNKSMRHLLNNGVTAPTVFTAVTSGKSGTSGTLSSDPPEDIVCFRAKSGQNLFVRMLNFLPGKTLAEVEVTKELCVDFGKFLGKMDRVFQTFSHPSVHRYMAWDLANGKKVVMAHLPVVQNPVRQALVMHFVSLYETQVEPLLPLVRKGAIHGDANDRNVLVTKNDNNNNLAKNFEISGILDFGDIVYTHIVNEISIAIGYGMLSKSNPIQIASSMVSGYNSEFPLMEEELKIVFILSCLRLCCSAVMGVFNINLQPENREYLEVHSKPAWELLEILKDVNYDVVYTTFKQDIANFKAI